MIKTDGIPPKLTGHICEELLCQQYWYHGRLEKEVDVLFIKADQRWHQLYFENGVIFWRPQSEPPVPYQHKEEDPFRYPLLDLGEQHGIKGQLITDCTNEPMIEGAKITLFFESSGKIVLIHQDNQTHIQYVK